MTKKRKIIQGPNGCGKIYIDKNTNGIIFPMEGSYTYEESRNNRKSIKRFSLCQMVSSADEFVFKYRYSFLWKEEEIAFGPIQMGLSKKKSNKEQRIAFVVGIETKENSPYHLA